MTFSTTEQALYARQFQLSDWGEAEQLLLKQARVLCIGAGGLGAPILRYLVGAGVGKVGIVDFDTVSLSNLHRQILYDFDDVDQPKIKVAARKLVAANPHIDIQTYPQAFEYTEGLKIAKEYDLIIDGSDNFTARYAANQVAIELNLPILFAAVQDFQGQVALLQPKHDVCFCCIFPEPPPAALAANCAENGILGTVPGMLGLMQAHLALLYLAGLYSGPFNEMLLFDLLSFNLQKFQFTKNPDCPACGQKRSQPETQAFLDGLTTAVCNVTEDISVTELTKKIKASHNFTLLDVREPYEHETFNIGGLLIPLAYLPDQIQHLDPKSEIIVYCQKGIRSKIAADLLRESGFQQVRSLVGGMDAWQHEVLS